MLPAIVLAALIASGMLLSKRDEVSAAPTAEQQSHLNRYADPGMTAAARLMDQRSARAADTKKDARAPTTVYSPLRGKQVPVEEMNLQLQPFYRGAAPGPIIDRETARVPDPKVETTLGAPIREYKVSDEEALNRETYGIAAGLSATRQGELLMTPQREQKPRAEHTARALPPNIDELRGSAKPRYVDAGRIIPGSAPIPARQTTPNFAKRTPEAFKTTTAADFLPTSAPAARQGDRPTQVIPNTARGVGATNYLSHAAGGGNLWSGAGGDLTHNPRFSPAALPIGTAGRAGAWDVGADISALQFRGDLRDNERDLQQGHGAALPMIGVKAGPGASYVSPERERTDWNMKTLSTGAPRVYGNMRGATALKQTMYDPNMVARTTLKETMIHDTTTGIAGPRADRGQARNTDVPDATIRNTLEPVDSNANLAPISTKAVVYDPDDLFEPTHRDTLGDAGRTGNVDTTPEGQGYMTAEVEAQNTQRQFQHREYTGIADRENGDAYRTTDATAPQTQREFVGNTGPSFGPGGAANTKKSMSYADIYAARFTGIKESILQGRAPTMWAPRSSRARRTPTCGSRATATRTWRPQTGRPASSRGRARRRSRSARRCARTRGRRTASTGATRGTTAPRRRRCGQTRSRSTSRGRPPSACPPRRRSRATRATATSAGSARACTRPPTSGTRPRSRTPRRGCGRRACRTGCAPTRRRRA